MQQRRKPERALARHGSPKPETLQLKPSAADARRMRRRPRREAAGALALACAKRRTPRWWRRRARCAPRPPPSSRPMRVIWRRRAGAGVTAAFLDRLLLDPKRVEAMAKGLEEVAALPDPVGAVLARWTRPNGLANRTRARAAGRGRHHLREPAERDGGCRRAVPQVRQRGDPARRLGQPSLQPRHPGLPGARPARGGPARDARSSSCPPPTARPSA